MMLPEEILHSIVEYSVSYPPTTQPQLLELHWKHTRTTLVPLSLASSQLRRICMPFLFAYVEVRGAHGELEKLRDRCNENKFFALSIRTFDYFCYSPRQIDVLHDLLLQCTNLSQLILNEGVYIDKPLLNAISQHRVNNVVVASWKSLSSKCLDQLGPSSLSQITLNSIRLRSQTTDFVNYLHSGMQIRCLTLPISPNELNMTNYSSLNNFKFSGLRELELWLNVAPDLSWLSDFIDAHPLLERVRFSSVLVEWNASRDVPFILPFVDALVEEGLFDSLQLKGFSISRTPGTSNTADSLPSSKSYHGWNVAGLWFCFTKWSSGRLLHLVHSIFPDISVLTVEAPTPNSNRTYMDSEQFINALQQFRSLRTVNLVYMFRGLTFDNSDDLTYKADTPHMLSNVHRRYPGHLGLRSTISYPTEAKQADIELEAALVRFASRIAQRVPTVGNFIIQEPPLRGLIHVNEGGTSGSLRPLMQFEMSQLVSLYV
ncbi:hypothetical protein C8R42DRAFT_299126 [Lentinula raphanica]|nr:hypothetical protein C8R42DRAFT_299126 [Lentinula raphanica]